MTKITYDDIVTPELLEGAIDNNSFEGFLFDYRVLHCLIRKYKPKTFFEVGTCDGTGAMVIKNALGKDAVLFSLDLPTEKIDKSLRVGKGDRVGKNCDLPFVQLRGDSMEFDFINYPCEGYWIDAAHTEENVYHEVGEALRVDPIIIILHDTDIPEVMRGLQDAVNLYNRLHIGFGREKRREIYRVEGTRVSYIIKKDTE